MSDPLNEIVPSDWLNNLVSDGIALPWREWQGVVRLELRNPQHTGEIWKQFDDHKASWWDTDLSVENTEEKAGKLITRLAGCTADQLDAVAELLYLAIKTTRTVCGDLEQD